MIVPKEIDKRMRDLVDEVKYNFKFQALPDVPFFIAGGSIFGTLNNSEWDDIDVFFYNKEDSKKVIENIRYNAFLTNNSATTVSALSNKRIQLTYVTFGDPETVFKTFDINCSMCAIDSNYEFHKSPVFSNDIEINFEYFKMGSLIRYKKYVDKKNAKDPEIKTFKEIIHFLLTNFDKEFPCGYDNGAIKTASVLIRNYLYAYDSATIHQYVHDKTIEMFGSSSVEAFKEIKCLEPPTQSDEFKAFKLLNIIEECWDSERFGLSPEDERIKLKFAEYFI